jgi:hypothetical protein
LSHRLTGGQVPIPKVVRFFTSGLAGLVGLMRLIVGNEAVKTGQKWPYSSSWFTITASKIACTKDGQLWKLYQRTANRSLSREDEHYMFHLEIDRWLAGATRVLVFVMPAERVKCCTYKVSIRSFAEGHELPQEIECNGKVEPEATPFVADYLQRRAVFFILLVLCQCLTPFFSGVVPDLSGGNARASLISLRLE